VKSLRARLFVFTLAAVILSVALSLAVGAILVRRSVQRSLLSNLGRQVDLIAGREASAPLAEAQLRGLRAALRRQGILLSVRPAPLSPGPGSPIPNGEVAAINGGQLVQGKTTFGGIDVLYAARRAGDQVIVLTRGAGVGASDWRPFLGSFVVAGLVGAAVAAGVSLLLARAIGRPVRRAAEATRRVAAGESPELLPVEGYDELAMLSSSFNDMALQLARAREAEQSFLLSVSHELKTPLTAIRGYAEALEEDAVKAKEAGQVLTAEAARLERLVQDLLDLARLNQRTFTVRSEPVDLSDTARAAGQRYEQRARSFGVSLEVDAPVGAVAVGDGDRLLQAVSNLVENALRVTPAGGSVRVSAAPGRLAVTDTGPGLAPEDLPRAFERFYLHRRYGGARPVGTGLGLALVKEFAEAMGGSVQVQSVAGAGTTFALLLPGPSPALDAPPAAAEPSTLTPS
jgi:two-component system, OmpR family, sensor kinase